MILLASFLIGNRLRETPGSSWLARLILATVLSATTFAILDMEFPRLGAFQLMQQADVLLVNLRRSMDGSP